METSTEELQKIIEKQKVLLQKAINRAVGITQDPLLRYFRFYNTNDGQSFTVVAARDCAVQLFDVHVASEFVVFEGQYRAPNTMMVQTTHRAPFSNLNEATGYFVELISK